ncbi:MULTISPECIES: alpha/beta hydrolase [unclassified Modestobacter]
MTRPPAGPALDRRRLLALAGHLVVGGVLAGCAGRVVTSPGGPDGTGGSDGGDDAAALTARPGEASPSAEPTGTHPLGVESERDALLHVPPGLDPQRPAPLVVSLHGAGGDAAGGIGLLRPLADERGLVLLAPASRGSTWDAVRGGFGEDVAAVDRALGEVFSRLRIDPGRVAVAGFSDGATYALGLGLANGELFDRILAFSPGFVPPGPRSGQPAVFVSHGTDDEVLPIDRTSRDLVPELRDDGYDVIYREFDGGHAVPPEIAQEAVDWLGW